jgi:beta-glucosidase
MNNPLDNADLNAKVEQLLARMTIEQKIGQMTQPERMACTPEDVKEFHIGSVLSGGGSCPGDNRPADWVEMNDAYWMASMEADEEHLAIPLLYGVDAIHGNGNVLGATVFPHNIGLGAARDPELVHRIAAATAREILATGVDWTFAPTLAVAKNLHWGRCYESYSSSPELVGHYAAPFVRGMQGDLGDDGVVACVKHWVGDGGTTHGIDQGETTLSFEELQAQHMAPYLPAIDAGVLTVMASFNSWNGDKCHGHHRLISEVLKGDLGFRGFVISDWDGIDYLSRSYFDAVAMAVNAGIDMFMVSVAWRQFMRHLRTHVEKGHVAESRVDDAVRRILRVKFAFGLFEKPRPRDRRWSKDPGFGGPEHRQLAREAVRKSLVLLKNDNATLPISREARILVAGKSANNRGYQCGGFTVAWQGVEDNDSIEGGCSIWEGIQALAPNATLSRELSGADAEPSLHDIAIVVIGERPYAEGMGDVRPGDNVIIEAGSQIRGEMKVLEPYGRTLEHAISHPEDLATIANIRAAGIPVVVVFVSGRPLIVNEELAAAQAFVAAWLPGSEGQGVAEVLFGDYDFQGLLPFAWPAKASETGELSARPLFDIGYGLRMQQA